MSAMRKKRSANTQKGDQTKALILETALEIFHERGYEQTTMRAIARKANLSLGNAYYYFHSKEHLIQAFYHRTHEEHLAASLPALERERTLKNRLLTVMRLKIETIEPYHEFAAALFKTAANPTSPLNPFSDESDPVRKESIELFAKVVDGSNTSVPKDLRAELPYLLWVYHMGITLFWIHDRSPKHRRTYRLVDHTVDLVAKLITLASNPLMRPLRKQALKLVDELREGIASEVESE
ncbi:MAG TPA: TetR family transcriptional regulator [Pyrinomonadaceae bacterium]|jgi:AcrR family transcriptional regulator|nr:TetR family transcriptional regulator [Pyrinomonadaceae bacterium]